MPSFLQSWFSWLLPRSGKEDSEPVSSPGEIAVDAYFTAVGTGQEQLPAAPASFSPGEGLGPLPVLRGGEGSGKPPSPLAAAYARLPTVSLPDAGPDLPSPASGAEWKVVEPPASPDAVPHEECWFVRRSPRWSLMGASVRGKLHAHQGLWRDDACAWGESGDWTCIAVADGAGSASLSRVGSRLACQESVRALTAALQGWQFGPAIENGPNQEDLHRLRTILADAARSAQAAIVREAQQRNCPLRDFHTTLLLLLHAPFPGEDAADLVAALQVGDGVAGLAAASGACVVLGSADRGAYSSETLFLTTAGIERDLERRITFFLPAELRGAVVATDGVADDFFPEQQRLGELFLGDPIIGLARAGPGLGTDLKSPDGAGVRGVLLDVVDEPRQGHALADWLRYEKRGSSDDRTLVLLYREQETAT